MIDAHYWNLGTHCSRWALGSDPLKAETCLPISDAVML